MHCSNPSGFPAYWLLLTRWKFIVALSGDDKTPKACNDVAEN
jgi:hypothetical protein